MAIFMVIGAVDNIFFNNKFGYGDRFVEGINSMGTLAIAMVGLMCFAPVLGKALTSIFSPFYRLIGADPAMIAGTVLALDMGGFPLSQEMTTNQDIVVLSGLILGSTLGCTIVFAIPVSLGIIPKKDHGYLAKGTMFGLVSVPVGCFVGGLLAGISIKTLVVNLSTIVIFSLLIIVALLKAPNASMKVFQWFAKFISVILVITFVIAALEWLLQIKIIPGMSPIEDQLAIVGTIGITLAGTFPFVTFLTKTFTKPFSKIGTKLGINDVSVTGLITTLANSIPVYGMVTDMDPKGKVMVLAFAVCAATALGDHLAFVAGNAPDYILPVLVGKLAGGILAIVLVSLFFKADDKEATATT